MIIYLNHSLSNLYLNSPVVQITSEYNYNCKIKSYWISYDQKLVIK